MYGGGATSTAMAADAISVFPGSGLPHDNMAPFQVLNFIIALEGVYPSPT